MESAQPALQLGCILALLQLNATPAAIVLTVCQGLSVRGVRSAATSSNV